MSADTEILFTIFDFEENRAISENYVVRWSRQGMMADISQFNNLRCIFTVKCLIGLFGLKSFHNKIPPYFYRTYHHKICIAVKYI